MEIQNKRMALAYAGLAVCNVLIAVSAQAQDVSFEAARNFAAGSDSYSVAVGDFNGDGRQDLAVADHIDNGSVSVLLGNGDGTFEAPRNFAAGNAPVAVAVGDFKGDGVQDLAVANASSNVSVLINNAR